MLIFSRFRQLHTTTNLLVLSLAVSDFIVGFLQMPVEILLFQGCWILGDFVCVVNSFLACLIISASIGNMVLISVDCYVAICEPMFYSTKVTLKRVQLCICLCWIFSAFHSSWFLRDFLKQPGRYSSCYGECVVLINYVEGAFDFVVTFVGPFSIIIVLYMRVFMVAVSQARAMRTQNAVVLLQHSRTITAKKSEMKAARTLGIVVVVFLLCSCPYYFLTVVAENTTLEASSTASVIWLLYLNSSLNPAIYAFFYPWFRKSVKRIVTLQTLKPGSSDANIM